MSRLCAPHMSLETRTPRQFQHFEEQKGSEEYIPTRYDHE